MTAKKEGWRVMAPREGGRGQRVSVSEQAAQDDQNKNNDLAYVNAFKKREKLIKRMKMNIVVKRFSKLR